MFEHLKSELCRCISVLLTIAIFIVPGLCQDSKATWREKLDDFNFKFSLGLQLWSTYTMDHQVYDQTDGRYEKVDNRFSVELRRTRLGLSGQPYARLKFSLVGSLDFVGRDLLSATQAEANNGSSPQFRIWNAFLQWKIMQKSDILHLTVGYLPPQIGRESIAPALRVTSMAKSWSQNYLRRTLVGIEPGRAVGINLGGMLHNPNSTLAASYDLGLFTPTYHSFLGNSVGVKSNPLLTGRIVFHIGDPEFSNYSIHHRVNYFNERKGVSIGVAAANQGKTEIFDQNLVLSFDWLVNWSSLNMDGEWSFLERNRGDLSSTSSTGFVRISNNFLMSNEGIFEIVACVTGFNGPLDDEGQRDANRLRAFAGTDYIYAIGCNYYFNPDLKLSINYSWQSADDGVSAPGATFNNYFFQAGVGAIRRGNWMGLGLVAIF